MHGTTLTFKNGWKKIDGKWYYFSNGCRMLTGWLQLEDKWYYLSESGAMVTGIQEIGGKKYCFANDGHMYRTEENGALF